MPIVTLNSKNCECGRNISTRKIDIEQFRKEMFFITERTLDIWGNKKRCWRCKESPEIGEKWGISINKGEKNRIYCPECSIEIERQLNEKEKR